MVARQTGLLRVLLPDGGGQLGIVGRAKGVVRGIDVAAPCVVLAVAADGQRDAQTALFGQLLHDVVALRQLIGKAVGVVKVMNDMVLINIALQGTLSALVEIVVRVGMDHQTGLFLDRHLADQVLCAGVDVQTIVLVGVQLAILVQVLKTQAVHLKDRRCALDVGQHRLPRAVIRLDHGVDAVHDRLLRGLRLHLRNGSAREQHAQCQPDSERPLQPLALLHDGPPFSPSLFCGKYPPESIINLHKSGFQWKILHKACKYAYNGL